MAQAHTQDRNSIYRQAVQFRQEKNYIAALENFMRYIEGAQPSMQTLQEIALLNLQLKKPQEAVRYFEKALALGQFSKAYYVDYASALISAGAFEKGENLLLELIKKKPKENSFLNALGVLYRRQNRYTDALVVLKAAQKLDKKFISPYVNMGNIYLDLKESALAVEMFKMAIQLDPKASDYPLELGKAYSLRGEYTEALKQIRLSVALSHGKGAYASKNNIAYLASILCLNRQYNEALGELEGWLRFYPQDKTLMMAKGDILQKMGKIDAAKQQFEALYAMHPQDEQLTERLGKIYADTNKEIANGYFEKLVTLSNRSLDSLSTLCESYNRSRYGNEGEHIQKAYLLACEILERFPNNYLHAALTIRSVFLRVCDHERLEKMGDMKPNRDYWVRRDLLTAFHYELSRVKSTQERLDILDYHKQWGKNINIKYPTTAIKHPLKIPRPKIRVGFMSSDLRDHPVGLFALPLLERYNKEIFEVYCYSFYKRQEDFVQKHITQKVDAFRWWNTKSDAEIAQGIANDELDILVELGGATDMNKIELLSHRLAPVQMSWLGYPHSAGLEQIDYLLVDPYLKPENSAMIMEKPFEVAQTWVSIGEGFAQADINPIIPQNRKGYLTFGTMNNPYKYTVEMFAAWAKIMQQVPHSRLLFVRPEGNTLGFRENIIKAFAAWGIEGTRILFEPVRGRHMPHYNEIDIALDTFPHVGGTTTCETLWMGVPVITLVGEAFFERLSYSNLSNAGLGDLCAFSVEEYIALALKLAQDKPRREFLRVNLRAQIRNSPLGKPQDFANNFYAQIQKVLRP